MPPIEFAFTQTVREEAANALSHGLACAFAIIAVPLMCAGLDFDREPLRWLGSAVFVATMALMYLVSALFHAVPVGDVKRRWRRADQATIFIFIAGSWTPFVLSWVAQGGDPRLLGAVWAVAALGALLKLAGRLRRALWSMGAYLAFGWAVLPVAGQAIAMQPPRVRELLVLGGLAYTVGCVFYLLGKRLRYSHLLWHLFVIAGSALHCLAVRALMLPTATP